MSVSIDDLKNDDGALNIDLVGGNNKNQSSNKTIVPNSNSQNNSERIEFDLTSLPDGKTEEDRKYEKEHYIDNPLANMLEGEDSMLGKYIVQKTKEIADNYNSIEQTKELVEAEQEIKEENPKIKEKAIDDIDNLDNVVSFSTQIDKKKIMNDNDILSALNDNEEEEELMNNEDVLIEEPKDILNDLDDVADEIDNEDEVEDIDLDSVSVDEETEVEEDKSTEEVVVDKKKPEEKEPEKKEVIKSDVTVETKKATINIIEADLDEEDEIERDNGQDDTFKKLQKMATERLKPVSKKLDISSFSVVKKPTTSIAQLKEVTSNVAKWVLYNQEAVIFMREFTGSELEKLREFITNNNSLDSSSKAYRMIYDHIESAKPASFETWLKTTPYDDINHLFFAIYISSFKESNYMPFDCNNDKCNESWISEDIPIMDMVNFESKDDKKKFETIYREEDESSASSTGLYVSEIVPINNKIAISFKEPSIYNSIELLRVDSSFIDKYSDIVSYLPYIDALYFIDAENKNLIPVGYKVYENNNNKSIKSKILQFSKVLGTLTIDEFAILRSYVAAINDRGNGITYKLPEHTCPKCGTVIPEATVSASDLLFTRYQLGALVSTSLN